MQYAFQTELKSPVLLDPSSGLVDAHPNCAYRLIITYDWMHIRDLL